MSNSTIKTMNIALLATLMLLQFALWTGDKNVFDLYLLKQSKTQTEQEITRLTLRNDRFLAQINDLKNGGSSIETLARQELGLIKEGETFYQVIQD